MFNVIWYADIYDDWQCAFMNLEVSEKYSYYSTQANTANKSQSDYVETHLSQKVKKVIYTISVNDVETSNEFSETETK